MFQKIKDCEDVSTSRLIKGILKANLFRTDRKTELRFIGAVKGYVG